MYERDDAIGGLLRYGIPDFKLEKQHIDRRLAQLRGRGGAVRDRACTVGVDVTADAAARRARRGAAGLRRAAPAGTCRPRPGAGCAGVHLAMEHLVAANRVVAGPAPGFAAPSLDAAGQARGHHRRRRHRRRLPRRGPPAGRGRASPARPVPAAAERARRRPRSVADLAVDPAHLPGARGGRRAGVRGRRAGVRRRRRRPGAGGADRRGDRGEARRPTAGHRRVPGTERELPADLVLLAIGFEGTERAAAAGPVRAVAQRAGGAVDCGAGLADRRPTGSSSPATCTAARR